MIPDQLEYTNNTVVWKDNLELVEKNKDLDEIPKHL